VKKIGSQISGRTLSTIYKRNLEEKVRVRALGKNRLFWKEVIKIMADIETDIKENPDDYFSDVPLRLIGRLLIIENLPRKITEQATKLGKTDPEQINWILISSESLKEELNKFVSMFFEVKNEISGRETEEFTIINLAYDDENDYLLVIKQDPNEKTDFTLYFIGIDQEYSINLSNTKTLNEYATIYKTEEISLKELSYKHIKEYINYFSD